MLTIREEALLLVAKGHSALGVSLALAGACAKARTSVWSAAELCRAVVEGVRIREQWRRYGYRPRYGRLGGQLSTVLTCALDNRQHHA